MHDNRKDNGKVHVKSITKFRKLEEWTHWFQDYCFHNNKSNESDWTTQPGVIATSCFVENSLYSSTKKDFRTRGSQAQVMHAGLLNLQNLNKHFLTVSKSQHDKTVNTIRCLQQKIIDLESQNLQTDGLDVVMPLSTYCLRNRNPKSRSWYTIKTCCKNCCIEHKGRWKI